jgi:hypothetical protein
VSTGIPVEVAEFIGFYVYALRDPRDKRVFYVGKGQGGRVLSHVREAGASTANEREKLRRIREIEADGRHVEHLFLRTHLSSEEALVVEQAVIDAYKASGLPLTNLVSGHDSSTYGLASVETVVAEFSALPAPGSTEPTLLFVINKSWRPDMGEDEVYFYTRGHWIVSAETRTKARYAFGVAHGIIRGTYKIDSWFPSEQKGEERRWGFHGKPAPEMAHFIGTSVRRFNLEGKQNPYSKYLLGIPSPDQQNTTHDGKTVETR